MDIDFSGNAADVLGRLAAHPMVARPVQEPAKRRGPGRPKLGVVSREVSLLPRHWGWLAEQRGGAPASLRRLVDAARKGTAGHEPIRRAIDAAHRFMWDMAVNDALGHSAGDEALRMFGARLTSVIRRADICARLGGDEFGLILAMGGAHGAAKIVAQKIIDAMVPPFSIQDHDCTLGCSIGIALYPEHGGEEQSLLTNSDAAMYRAKRNGSGYVLCDAVEQRQVV